MHINNIGLPCYLRAHDRACDFTATPRRPYIEIKKKKENWKGRKIERLIVHLSAGDIYIYTNLQKVGCITRTKWMLIT